MLFLFACAIMDRATEYEEDEKLIKLTNLSLNWLLKHMGDNHVVEEILINRGC